MEFNSQIATTKEQSEKLLSLGLKRETADMCYRLLVDNKHHTYYSLQCVVPRDIDIPAWSLHRLMEMYVERYISCSMNLKNLTYEWIINEIETHIKDGDFNKDYLEEK